MPFELTNSPSALQALKNDMFIQYLSICMLVFFDDILIYSKGNSLPVSYLREVLSVNEELPMGKL